MTLPQHYPPRPRTALRLLRRLTSWVQLLAQAHQQRMRQDPRYAATVRSTVRAALLALTRAPAIRALLQALVDLALALLALTRQPDPTPPQQDRQLPLF